MNKELKIGVVGAGGFAHFAAKSFLEIDGVSVIAVSDVNETAAKEMANEFKAVAYSNIDDLLNNKEVDLVYIATPPFLHYEQSKRSLIAKKHVICEKPAALITAEAKELHELALSVGKLYVVNLMQRYNPLYDVIKKIIHQKLLGDFLHGFFENYASDEYLDDRHWFWDKDKSGGIFIEHGVHFFDMFAGWVGNGKVLSAIELNRPEVPAEIIDRVQATVLYDKGLVNFYHGFDQPKILDRQELRLQFERGEITLYGWVPVSMRLHGIFQRAELNNLKNLVSVFSILKEDDHKDQQVKGRFKEIYFDKEMIIEYGDLENKQKRYSEMLKMMLADQWAWIKDKHHVRLIDSSNAIESLFMAEQATKLAQKNIEC